VRATCTWSTSTARGPARRRASTISRGWSPSWAFPSSTAAFADVDFLDEADARYGERIVVSVDTRGGFVSTAGWTETTTLPAEAAIERLQDRGVRTFVYTNVDRDGLLGGPDLDEICRVAAAVRGHFMYSGGIGKLDDLVALAGLRQVNLTGVIAGKALYERRFTVGEGIAALAASGA
jgi:phosphoribosylformimino-5-aminoimidazole carboxamide ribonucleotide (ProFAR) isomerase